MQTFQAHSARSHSISYERRSNPLPRLQITCARRRPQVGCISSRHRSRRTCLCKTRGADQRRGITDAAICRLFKRTLPGLTAFRMSDGAIHSRGSKSLALAVARKLAAYLLAIDRGERAFVKHEVQISVAA